MIGAKEAVLAAFMIAAGLALWWSYGPLVVLAEPAWFCLPR
jgi:hypothetical protein